MDQEIQGMLKSCTNRRSKKYSHGYLVKSNSPILSAVILAHLAYFLFILPRSCLFRLAAVGSGLYHIL